MYELFTLGGGTYLVDLLNAVAAITSGGAYVTLAQLAGVSGLAWVLFRTALGGSWKDNAKWLLLFVTVWGVMIVPKATVRVVDRLDPALAPAVVANVPIGLALFASLTSQVGDGLTRLTEQAFTLPDDLAYRRHGLIFGARLAGAMTRLEITDTVFARNMRNYARQCVFHALLLGHISADDLRESTDLWSLVTAGGTPSAGASPARMFEFATRLAAVGTGATPIDREIVTCQAGAGRLNAQWNAEIARAGTVFGRRIFPDARTETLARAELLAALPAAHDFLIGAARSAGEIMRQQMVLNAVHDAGEQWAAEAGNAAALQAYTEARAEAQTVSAYRAIGRQAETWVPLLKIVFECLYIGAFPMAVLLMLTPAGAAIFRSYVTGLVWLQSWGSALRRAAPDQHGGSRGKDVCGGGDAGGRDRHLAGGPGRDPGGGVRRRGDVGLPLDVGAVPRRRAGLRALEGDDPGDLGAGRRPGRGIVGGPRGDDGQPFARQHRLRHAPVRDPRRAPDPHLGPCRYRPLHRLRPCGRGHDGDRGRDCRGRCRRRHQPDTGRGRAALGIAGHQPREPRRRSTHPVAQLVGGSGPGEERRRYRRDGDDRALFARCQHRHGPRQGVTESESSQAQQLDSHVGKLSEIAGITKEQAAVLTGQATVGGSWDFIVKAGADGSVMWRGQTFEAQTWNRIKEYDRQHGVTENWSQVSEASRRYSTQTGDSEMAGLDESLSANLTRMQSFQERASLARQESENWSEQAAQVRTDAQSIGRELGQPFFAWLSERTGSDGRAIGAAGAMRIASPQTAEDSEQLREHAAAFIAEKFPAPAGPDPASVGGAAEYEGATGEMRGAYGRETAAAYGGWSAGVRDRGAGAGAPRPGAVDAGAMNERVETKTDMIMKGAAREARQTVTGQEIAEGSAGVEAETRKPFEQHATESLPVVGDWLSGQLFGTAKNAVPDAAPGSPEKARPQDQKDWGDSSP